MKVTRYQLFEDGQPLVGQRGHQTFWDRVEAKKSMLGYRGLDGAPIADTVEGTPECGKGLEVRAVRIEDGRVQRVVCAALRLPASEFVVVGPRHFDATMRAQLRRAGVEDASQYEQGFIDQDGVFLTRRQAWCAAQRAGQVAADISAGDAEHVRELFSEDIY